MFLVHPAYFIAKILNFKEENNIEGFDSIMAIYLWYNLFWMNKNWWHLCFSQVGLRKFSEDKGTEWDNSAPESC